MKQHEESLLLLAVLRLNDDVRHEDEVTQAADVLQHATLSRCIHQVFASKRDV